MRIGIAGVGGIGSNVAVHLVRSGVNHLKIVDDDRVEASNLNRQFYFKDQIGGFKVEMLVNNLKRIAPKINIEALTLKLEPSNMVATFADCPIVVEGFDSPSHKKMLLEALTASGHSIVAASGVAGINVDHIAKRQLGRCTIVGDFETDCRQAELYSHKVATIAAIMAGVVLERMADGQNRAST